MKITNVLIILFTLLTNGANEAKAEDYIFFKVIEGQEYSDTRTSINKETMQYNFQQDSIQSIVGENYGDGEQNNKVALFKSPFSLGFSLQTKYIWRGMEMQTEDAAPTLFPSIGYSYKGLYIYAMGGYNINGKYAEVDYGVSYTRNWMTVGVNDYYYPTTNTSEDEYFNYNGHSTGHWLEGVITIAPKKFPISLTVSNFFAGADKDHDGTQAYSTYAELSSWYEFLNDHRISATCGMAFNKSCYNGYAHDFGICNIEATYTYNLTFKNGTSSPLSCSYILNPIYKKSYVNFTVSLTL